MTDLFTLQGKRVVVDGRIAKFPKRTLAADLAALGATLCDRLDDSIDAALIGTVHKNRSLLRDDARGYHIPVFEDAHLKELLTKGEVALPRPPVPSSTFDALVGELRALLAAPVSAQTWAAIQALLDDCVEQDIAHATQYVADQLSKKDEADDLCIPSSRWIRDLSKGHKSPKYALVRHWSTSALEGTLLPRYMKEIWYGEQLTNLRVLSSLVYTEDTLDMFQDPRTQRTLSQITKLVMSHAIPDAVTAHLTHVKHLSLAINASYQADAITKALETFAPTISTLELINHTHFSSAQLPLLLPLIEPHLDHLTHLDTLILHQARLAYTEVVPQDVLDEVSASLEKSRLFSTPGTITLHTTSPDMLRIVCRTLAKRDPPQVKTLDLSPITGFVPHDTMKSQLIQECIADTGLGERLDRIVLGDCFPPEVRQELADLIQARVDGPARRVEPSSTREEQPSAQHPTVPATSVPDGEARRREAHTFSPQDVLNAANALAQREGSLDPLIHLIDWAVETLEDEPIKDLFTQLYAHPMLRDGLYLPKGWEHLLFLKEARDPRLTLVKKVRLSDSDFYLASGSSADMKQMASWISRLASAPWIDVLSHIDIDIYYFTGQKGLLGAITELVEATRPRVMTTRIKQAKKDELLRAHLEAKGLLPPQWNPPRASSPAPDHDEAEELRARRVQKHELRGAEQWEDLMKSAPHEDLFALKLECHASCPAIVEEEPPTWETLRALEVHSTRGVVLDLQTGERLARWFKHARPILIDINEPHLYRDLIAQGIYSRALGSSITLHPYTTREHLAQLFERDSEVRVRHIGLANTMSRRMSGGVVTRLESSVPGYETPPDEALSLLDLIEVAPESLKQHSKSLSWALGVEDLPHLDAIFEAFPRVEELEWHVRQWSAHASTYLQAFAQCAALANVHTCRIRDHWSMHSPDKVKQLDARQRKILDGGEGLSADAILISN